MKLFHPITGCKNSNSTWYLREFFGTDVMIRGGKPVCKICFGEFVEQPEDFEDLEEEKQVEQ